MGSVGGGSDGADCGISGDGTICCCNDGIVPLVALVGWRIFGLGIHLFGRNISYYGDDFVGATLHDVIPLHLLYGVIYRPSGARSGVVAVDDRGGSNVALLPTAVIALRKAEKGVG